MVDNELITEYIVSNDICFRLGTEGPVFRFLRNAEPDELTATMTIETQPGPVFQLDQRKLQQDVGEIAEGAYFHTLQQRAIDMRRQRNSD